LASFGLGAAGLGAGLGWTATAGAGDSEPAAFGRCETVTTGAGGPSRVAGVQAVSPRTDKKMQMGVRIALNIGC
jgi:hypothetical protein